MGEVHPGGQPIREKERSQVIGKEYLEGCGDSTSCCKSARRYGVMNSSSFARNLEKLELAVEQDRRHAKFFCNFLRSLCWPLLVFFRFACVVVRPLLPYCLHATDRLRLTMRWRARRKDPSPRFPSAAIVFSWTTSRLQISSSFSVYPSIYRYTPGQHEDK